jgi:hypothetical protein
MGKWFSRKIGPAVAIAMLLAMALPWIAVADDVSNNLDASVEAIAEVMPLNVGGANGTTQLYIVARNDDGKNGCNLTGSTTLTVAISSNNTPVATVSPSSHTFTSCGDTATLTVTPHSQGSATISVSQTSNTTTGSFNLAPATFTVNVAPPANTAPSVSVGGVTGGAAYEIGFVPAATCNVTDAEDGNSSFAATLSAITGPLAAYGLGDQTASCSYTDGGGLTASASETYSIVDTGAPVITDLGPTAGPNGANGWYTSAVTNQFTASDSGAGFAGQTNPHTFSVSSGLSEGSAVKINSGTVSDVAGNSASSIDSAAFKIDLSDPTNVAFVGGGIASGGVYYYGYVPAAPTCTADDAISGLASCDVTGYSTAVGNHTLTATATDNAGRTATIQSAYSVLSWTAKGFYQPVDMGANVFNTVKGGATVPLKFEVFAGNTELTNVGAITSLTYKWIVAPTGATTDDIELTATGGTSLRYDTTGGQFIFNFQTPKQPGKCLMVTIMLQDGSTISANFMLK